MQERGNLNKSFEYVGIDILQAWFYQNHSYLRPPPVKYNNARNEEMKICKWKFDAHSFEWIMFFLIQGDIFEELSIILLKVMDPEPNFDTSLIC